MMGKRDADDILREEGLDALRAQSDAAVVFAEATSHIEPHDRAIVRDFITSMRRSSTVNDKIAALREAGARLHEITSSEAIEFVSAHAIDVEGLDPDAVQAAITAGANYSLDARDRGQAKAPGKEVKPAIKPNGRDEEQEKPLPPLLSKRDFLAGFVPPDYLIDGVLQRRFIYSLTGGTGHAKTAIALLIAQLVSSRDHASLGTHPVQKGRVIYFVGENPDDVRMRIIGADAKRDDDTDDQISFLPGVFSVDKMRERLATEAEKIALVIIDTSAAYFLGNDEISNPQMGSHARMLRTLTTLPGGPCVLVLCHPIKHVSKPDELLPRGGGAFLAEVDGNLTAWRDGDVITLHYTGKIRGPGFEPITFKLDKITTTKLIDSQGRLMPTVRAVAISEREEEAETRSTLDDENLVLLALKTEPDRSIGEIARACQWTLQNGEPYKSKVHRLLSRMEKSKPKLVAKDRGDRWKLTDAGRTQADRVTAKLGGDDFRVALAQELDLRGGQN